MMEIITNNVARELCALADLPEKVRKDFDYIKDGEEYSPRLVCYKGSWYDVHDTQVISTATNNRMGFAMQVDASSPFAKWDSIISETFFSGVLFRLNNDDTVIVGRYSS